MLLRIPFKLYILYILKSQQTIYRQTGEVQLLSVQGAAAERENKRNPMSQDRLQAWATLKNKPII